MIIDRQTVSSGLSTDTFKVTTEIVTINRMS